MAHPADLTEYTAASTLRLTTRGRKTMRPHTVTVWFVVADSTHLYVQHVRGRADWFRNLAKTSSVTIDFGTGPLAARARPVATGEATRQVLRLFRRKYRFAWLLQLLGFRQQPVAASIILEGNPAESS